MGESPSKRSIRLQIPWMSDEEIGYIRDKILKMAKSRDRIDVLEWGSGYSTKYYTELMLKNGIEYSWDTMEYSRGWYEKVKNWRLKNVRAYLFPTENPEESDMNEFVKFPATLKKKYDLIIVDGRKRVRCMLEAKKLLKKNGIVILHDADRKNYHEAFKFYKKGKLVMPKLWVGGK